MNFLGCEGMWQVQDTGEAVCQGELQTFTVQEMRDSLTPLITMDQKMEITGALLVLFVMIWAGKTVRDRAI
jgi:hypothetical protein